MKARTGYLDVLARRARKDLPTLAPPLGFARGSAPGPTEAVPAAARESTAGRRVAPEPPPPVSPGELPRARLSPPEPAASAPTPPRVQPASERVAAETRGQSVSRPEVARVERLATPVVPVLPSEAASHRALPASPPARAELPAPAARMLEAPPEREQHLAGWRVASPSAASPTPVDALHAGLKAAFAWVGAPQRAPTPAAVSVSAVSGSPTPPSRRAEPTTTAQPRSASTSSLVPPTEAAPALHIGTLEVRVQSGPARSEHVPAPHVPRAPAAPLGVLSRGYGGAWGLRQS